MKKLMATKATDLTVGQSFQYMALLFVFIYAPLWAVYWIYNKVEEWKTEKTRKELDERFEESMKRLTE